MRLAYVAIVALATTLPGCVQLPEPPSDLGETRPLMVFVENDVLPEATFEVTVNEVGPIREAVAYTGSAPNVKQAYNGTVHGDVLHVTVRVLETGAEKTFQKAAFPNNFLVAEAYRNGTVDAWLMGTQPYFD